jgi:hypothetical protein
MELPDLGGGPRELIQAIDRRCRAGDPRAHVKINATANQVTRGHNRT